MAIEQLSQREVSPFIVDPEDARVIVEEIAPYWKGKTYHEPWPRPFLKRRCR